jgi:hypothetical protein
MIRLFARFCKHSSANLSTIVGRHKNARPGKPDGHFSFSLPPLLRDRFHRVADFEAKSSAEWCSAVPDRFNAVN